MSSRSIVIAALILALPCSISGQVESRDSAAQVTGADTATNTAPATPRGAAAPRNPEAAALFDALGSTRTLAALDSIARSTRGDALAQAMISARRHELTGDIRDAQRAFDQFYAIASADTTDGWAFFGLGRVVSARPAVLFDDPGILNRLLPPRRIAGVLGLEPQSRAQQAMLRALLIDPTIEQAALLIADMAVVSMDPLELEIAARALSYVTERAEAAPEVWLALARVRGLMADVDAANAAAQVALREGADASLALLGAASALLTRSMTQDRGAEMYLEGTRLLTDAGAVRYYRDVEQILTSDDRRLWRGLGSTERGEWLRRYWELRAALAGITVAHTLGEHYRMVAQADRHYGGEYGEPSPVDQMLGTGDHFPNTVSPGFTQPLDFMYDLYQFLGEDGRTSVSAALAVPTDQLRPMLSDSQVVYGLGVSMILIDTVSGTVSRTDTTFYFASARLADAASYMRAYVEVEQEPSERTLYRLSVHDAFSRRTGALFGGGMVLRDFDDRAIELSDIVLTRPDSGSWRRGELTFPLTPAQSFGRNEPITVFYEIYNLQPDSPYRTRIRVVPEARGLLDRVADVVNPGSRSLSVSFEAGSPATAGPVQEVRTVQAGLRPDRYVIEVTVTDLRTGDRATSRSTMTLVEEE